MTVIKNSIFIALQDSKVCIHNSQMLLCLHVFPIKDLGVPLPLDSKAEVAHFFRGIYCVLTTDEKKVQALFQIYVVLCLWTARFAD